MQDKKKVVIKRVAALAVVLVLCGCVLGFKNYEYHLAMDSVENFRYELAEQQFLNMNGYKNSEEMAVKMAELTEVTKSEIIKLLPIPEFDSNNYYQFTYLCDESKLAIEITWRLENMMDFYAEWGENYRIHYEDDKSELFFGEELGNIQNDVHNIRLVRYDQNTGEYILIQYTGAKISGELPVVSFAERYRAKLNADGSLEVYNKEGEHYVFLPYSYQDHTTGKQKVVNSDLK